MVQFAEMCDVDSFKQFFKQSCSALTSVTSALRGYFQRYALYKSTFYLLT